MMIVFTQRYRSAGSAAAPGAVVTAAVDLILLGGRIVRR